MSNFLVALQLDLSPSGGFYYGQFSVEQKLQALSLHEEGYSTVLWLKQLTLIYIN